MGNRQQTKSLKSELISVSYYIKTLSVPNSLHIHEFGFIYSMYSIWVFYIVV